MVNPAFRLLDGVLRWVYEASVLWPKDFRRKQLVSCLKSRAAWMGPVGRWIGYGGVRLLNWAATVVDSGAKDERTKVSDEAEAGDKW